MKFLLLVAAGGAIGSSLRYLVYKVFVEYSLSKGIPVFPWATIAVNVVGSFFMGYMFVLLLTKQSGNIELRVFCITGILGGFTTFSAFSLDAYELYINRNLTLSALYSIGTVFFSLLALLVGMALSEWSHS